MTERDFLAEMNAACRAEMDASTDPLRLVAEKLVARLRMDDPELLGEWLALRATTAVGDHLAHMNRADRAVTRARSGPRAFDVARRAFEAGDTEALGAMFRARYLVGDGTERRVADMTGPDHLFVSARYRDDSKHAAHLARVHRLVAQKVGDRKTSEVYTEEEYAAMFGGPQRAGSPSAA